MAHTLTEAVHVNMRAGGETIDGDFGPGTVELPEPVAELLIAQGLAAPASSKTKTTKTDQPVKDIAPEA